MPGAAREQIYNRGRIGWGRKPALLVIDFQRYFAGKDSPFAGLAPVRRAMENTAVLLPEARRRGIPVIYTVEGFRDPKEMGLFRVKIPDLIRCRVGSRWLDICPEVKEKAGDTVLVKRMSSAFFQTGLHTLLRRKRIDTILLTGCVTSGCIRATAIDSFSRGYRTIVIRDCCGDYDAAAHRANLKDMEKRYVDVLTLSAALDQLPPPFGRGIRR